MLKTVLSPAKGLGRFSYHRGTGRRSIPITNHRPEMETKIRIPKAGKLFLGMLLVIFLPAYTLSVNLMHLLGSLFAGAFVFNVFSAYWNLRGLHLEVKAPAGLYAGGIARLKIAVRNEKTFFFKSHFIHLRLWADQRRTGSQTLAVIPARGKSLADFPLETPHRGWLNLTAGELTSAYPFGLVEYTVTYPLTRRLLIYPKLLSHAPLLQGAENKAMGLVPQKSDDFQYLSAYRPGDDVRLIHWRKSTLLDTPVLRRTLSRSDLAEPKTFYPDACPQFEYAISTMATYFCETDFAQGWRVLTAEGICDIKNREQMLAYLALIQPLPCPEPHGTFSGGERPVIYASQIVPRPEARHLTETYAPAFQYQEQVAGLNQKGDLHE